MRLQLGFYLTFRDQERSSPWLGMHFFSDRPSSLGPLNGGTGGIPQQGHQDGEQPAGLLGEFSWAHPQRRGKKAGLGRGEVEL